MASEGPSILSAFIHYFADQANVTIPPVTETLKAVCAAGDILCEMTDGKRHLLPMLSHIINTAEETTGISRYYSGPLALLAVGAIGANYIYRKYNAKTAFDVILNIVKAEFGNSAVALEVFNALKQSIEQGIDAQVDEFIQKYAKTSQGMDKNAKVDAKSRLTKALLDRIMPTLTQSLKANKEQLEATAKDAASSVADIAAASTVVLPAVPGAQNDAAPVKSMQAQAKTQLKQILFAKIVNQEQVVQSLKAKV